MPEPVESAVWVAVRTLDEGASLNRRLAKRASYDNQRLSPRAAWRRRSEQRATAEEPVTIIAHDLSNYLTPLKGQLGLTQCNAALQKHDTYLAQAPVMGSAVTRLQKMVGNVLGVAGWGRASRNIAC